MTRGAAVGLVVLAAACTHPQPKRMAWLERTLLEDNQVYLARDPDEVAGKFARMALDVHAYFRGTAPQFYRDMAGDDGATAYGAAAAVLVVGDPHVENLGTFRGADGALRIEWNDFDAAALGAYHLDVRRLALSLWLVARDDRVVAAMAGGYVDELLGGDGEDDRPNGRILDALIARAGAAEAVPNPDEIVAATPDEQRLVAEILGAAVTAKEVTRRRGAGIASFPVRRFYAVVDDGVRLEIKEARPSPAARGPQAAWATDAERVVAAQRGLQSASDLDPWLRAASAGGASWRIRSIAGQQRLALGADWRADDLLVLADRAGRLLARAHASSGRAVIVAALHGDVAGFVTETVEQTRRYGKRTRKDYELFLRLLARRGPLLGWRAR